MANAEQLSVKPEDNPQSQEYIDQMVEKGTAAVNGGKTHAEEPAKSEVPAKPEGIPDKFYDAETGVVDYAAMAKSYTELESKLGSSNKPAEPPKEEPKGDTKEGEKTGQEEAAKAVEEAGLDFDSLSQEYSSKGGLTEESYEKLEKGGIPRHLVDSYIEGRLAAVEVARTHAYSLTEGAEGYKAMVDWAKANATAEEIEAYNKAVNSGKPSERELAVRGMWGRYQSESGGSQADLVTGNSKPGTNLGGYQSRAEMMRDMDDPKYKSDPAFRKQVEQRLVKSDIF